MPWDGISNERLERLMYCAPLLRNIPASWNAASWHAAAGGLGSVRGRSSYTASYILLVSLL